MDIPSLIAAAVESSPLTQEDLAARLGVSRMSLSRWKAGKVTPSLADLEAIAKETGHRLDISFRKIRKRPLQT